MKNKTILITGATGLLGSNAVKRLLPDNKIIALSRNENKLKELFKEHLNNPNFQYIAQDISSPIEIDEPIDIILHAAGAIAGEVIRNYPVDIMLPNIIGTKNCLDFLLEQEKSIGKKGRIVLFSSATVYKNITDKDIVVTEEDTEFTDKITSPISAYSQSKRCVEALGLAYFRQYNLDVLIARFSYVFGYTKFYPNTAFYDFIKKALNGENIILNGSGYEKRDNIYVEDAISGLIEICKNGVAGEAYNISSGGKNGHFAGIDEIAELIAKAANKLNNTKVKVIQNNTPKPRNSGLILDNSKLSGIVSGGGRNTLYDCILATTISFKNNKIMKGGDK